MEGESVKEKRFDMDFKFHRKKLRTRDEAKEKIFEYVEMYYNCRRAHSTLGNPSPFEYERHAILS